MKPVAIVQHERSVPPGLISEVLSRHHLDAVVVEAWTDASWPSVEDFSALVVMGGTMNVDESNRYPFLARSRELMARSLEKDIPTLGVCLGSQMMARVLGAEVRRASARNALFSPLELTREGASDPLTQPFESVHVLQFHEDTFDVPGDAVALASSRSSGLAQAFRFGRTAYAMQFHFEVDRSILDGWMQNIGRQRMLDEWGVEDADFLRASDVHLSDQASAGRELVRRFVSLLT